MAAESFWLPPVQEAGVAKSNQARKGDADYGVVAYGKPGARDEDFEKKHKRGARGTREGGRFVQKGDAGTDVRRVERSLGRPETGKYDAALASAVIDFQRRHGLKVDGIVGRQTARALAGDVAGARRTTPGAMRGRERRLLRAERKGKGKTSGSRRTTATGRGTMLEAVAEEEAFDESDVIRDFKGRFARKGLRGGKPGGATVAAVIPTYDGSKLTFGKQAGGSNGARFASHEDGTKWLVKTYAGNEDRIATELIANAVYREMGARVPRAGMLKLHNGKMALTYPLIDGKPRPYVFQGKGGAPSPEVGKHFMTDALLANWDVAGLEDDNILWDSQGLPFRVDQGGTLEFRAMGGGKPFGPVPLEVQSMMAPGGQSRRSALVTADGMRAQAREIAERLTPGKVDAIIDAAPWRDEAMRERVRRNLKARVAWMALWAEGKASLPQLKESTDAPWLAPLREAAVYFNWVELDHPRDQLGKFRKKIGTGAKIDLDSKTYVKQDKDGSYRVVRSGQIIKGFQTPGDAARAALDRSAKSGDADSVGGPTKFKDFDDYIKQAYGLDPDAPDTWEGSAADKEKLQAELTRLEELHAKLVNSDDKYQQRAAVDIERRAKNAVAKLQKAGGSAAGGGKGTAGKFIANFDEIGGVGAQIEIVLPSGTPSVKIEVYAKRPDGTLLTKKLGEPDPSDGAHGSIPPGMKFPEEGFKWKLLKKGSADGSAAAGAPALSPGGIKLKDGLPAPGEKFESSGAAQFESLGIEGAKFKAKVLKHKSFEVGSVLEWPVGDAKAYTKGNGFSGAWKAVDAALAPVAPEVTATTAPAAPKGKKVGKNVKQPVPAGENGLPAKLKELALEPGDKVQFKKGGWTYEYVEATSYGNLTFKSPTGKTKTWMGHSKPAFVMKASGEELKLGKPEGFGGEPAPASAPAASALSVETAIGTLKHGDKLVYGSGTPYTLAHLGPGLLKPWQLKHGASGGAFTYTEPELKSLLATGDGWKKAGGDAGSAMTPEQISAKLEPGAGKWPNIGALKDGAVFETPAGQIGVIAKDESAYPGYVAAFDIKTGAKFEPHATNYAPHKASEDPAVIKAAADQLAKAKKGGPSASSASAPKPPPVQVHSETSHHPSWDSSGALSGEAAEDHMHAQQPTLPAAAKSAMKSYTNGGYGQINGGLRNGTLSPSHASTVAQLDQAFHDAPPLDVDIITHRGAQLEDFHGKLEPGKIIQDLGYLSTSPTNPWGKDVQLHMRLKAGLKGALWVDNFSAHGGERELVIKRAAVMHVLQVEKVGGKTHVYVDVYG